MNNNLDANLWYLIRKLKDNKLFVLFILSFPKAAHSKYFNHSFGKNTAA